MLIQFIVKNYRSFYEEETLNLLGSKDETLKNNNTFILNKELLKENDLVLKSALIYGNNASGKSNLLKALSYMQDAVMTSNYSDIISKNEPFIFIVNNDDTLFLINIVENNIYYEYGFTINDGRIKSEWLNKRSERLTPIFKRENDVCYIISKEQIKYNVSTNTLFLSIYNNYYFNNKNYFNDVYNFFTKLDIIFNNDKNSLDIFNLENGKYKDEALKILAKGDIGIFDINIIKETLAKITPKRDVTILNNEIDFNDFKFGELKEENNRLYNLDLETKYKLYNKDKEEIGLKNIKLYKNKDFNSDGTISLINYLGFILLALDKGHTLFIDEFDSRLHYLITNYILKLFNSNSNNKAQLIITTFNVMLMDDDIRRDQILFVNKDKYGISHVSSLSLLNGVRKNDIFSKKYLKGLYVDVPNINE